MVRFSSSPTPKKLSGIGQLCIGDPNDKYCMNLFIRLLRHQDHPILQKGEFCVSAAKPPGELLLPETPGRQQLQELQDKAEGKQGGVGSSAPRTSCLAGSRKEDAILPGNTAFPRTPPPQSSTKQTKHPCFLLARNEDIANMATGEDLVEGKKK